MKNIYKKSSAFFMALALIAMVLVGCSKKDNASSDNNGGGTPTANYGTIQVGNQKYTIRIAGYEVGYNSTIQADALTVAFADATTENANIFGVSFPNCEEMPTGTFNYSNDLSAEGMCYGILKSSDNNVLYCTSGSITITKNGSNYNVESEGTANTLFGTANTAVNFSVDFAGPIHNDTK